MPKRVISVHGKCPQSVAPQGRKELKMKAAVLRLHNMDGLATGFFSLWLGWAKGLTFIGQERIRE